MQGSGLFNIINLSDDNKDYYIEFYAGDILDVYSDILLISAFKKGYLPVKNTIWGAIKEKYNLSFKLNLPDNSKSLDEHFHHFGSFKNESFNDLFVVELKEFGDSKNFSLSDLKSRFNMIFKNRHNFINDNHKSLSIPLLGTGREKLDLNDVIKEIYDLACKLKDTTLKVVRIFAYSYESIGLLNMNINHISNQIINHNNSKFLNAVIEEITFFHNSLFRVKLVLAFSNITIPTYQ